MTDREQIAKLGRAMVDNGSIRLTAEEREELLCVLVGAEHTYGYEYAQCLLCECVFDKDAPSQHADDCLMDKWIKRLKG